MSGGLDIEGVLAGHEVAELIGNGKMTHVRCRCGRALPSESAHRRHVDTVLRQHIAAWLDNDEAAWKAANAAWTGAGGTVHAALGRLAALVAPSRVPGEET